MSDVVDDKLSILPTDINRYQSDHVVASGSIPEDRVPSVATSEVDRTEGGGQNTEDGGQGTEDGIQRTVDESADVDVRNPEIENPEVVSVPEPVIDDTAVGAEPTGNHPNVVEPVGATPPEVALPHDSSEMSNPATPPGSTSAPVDQITTPEVAPRGIVAEIEKAPHPFSAATKLISENDPANPTGAIKVDEAIRKARENNSGGE